MSKSTSQCCERLADRAEKAGRIVEAASYRIRAKRYAKREEATEFFYGAVCMGVALLPIAFLVFVALKATGVVA